MAGLGARVGLSHFFQVRDHIRQFCSAIFRGFGLGGILSNSCRERHSKLERDTTFNTRREVSSDAARGQEGSKAFSLAC